MAKFIPFATTNLISKPYTDGYMWVDKETGQIRFDVDGVSVYAAGSATPSPITDYTDLENKPIAYYSDVDTLLSAITSIPLYFKWNGASETLVDSNIELTNGMLYFAMRSADNALEINAVTGRMPEIEYKNILGIPIKVVDNLSIFETLEQADYPFYFTWTADTLEVSEEVTLIKHGIYIIKDSASAPVLLAGNSGSGSGGGVTDYNDLTNKPIKRSNLSSASSLTDRTYYLNDTSGKLKFTENPTNVDNSLVNAIYYNPYIPIELVGQSLISMPWDVAHVEDVDGMSARFLQLIGADTIENSSMGIYAAKIPFLGLGDLYYIIAGVPSFNSEPQILLQYSADFGPHDFDSGVDAWGWMAMGNENFELATKSPIGLFEGYTFTLGCVDNKEYWDTWFSTSDEFASSFDFEANTIYRYADKAFKKIDGNAIEPVDALSFPSEALNHKVVYNKSDNQLYECKELTRGTTESPISYASLLPATTTWSANGTGNLGTFHVNTSLDVNTVKAIFPNDASGTLITAYDSCGITPYYVSYQHSNGVLQIIDNTDSCSARTIFDSSAGGWQTDNGGWGTGTSSGKYAYPTYTLKSNYNKYNMRLSEQEAPKGCLFSAADGGFASYKIVDGIYLNVHEKFDGSKMFADSSRPMFNVMFNDISSGSTYALMFMNSASVDADGGWMIFLENWQTDEINVLYCEDAFVWDESIVGVQMSVETAGWQSEYVDLVTGALNVLRGDPASMVGRALIYLLGEMEITEDVLGNYLSASPFTKIEGIYTWSKLAGDSDTLKLSGDAYKIIQPTAKALEINQSNSADNIIVLGSVADITIKNRALKTLTYIGRWDTLRVDFSDWSNSSEIPYINLIGDGSATIVANRANIKATDSVSIVEYNQDDSGYANWCSVETPGTIEYYLARENRTTYQPIIVKCDRFNLHNDNNLSRYNLHRSISADCRIFNIYGDTDFLHNEKNKYDTRSGGSSLTLKMPIESDGCYAFPNAGPGSIIGDKYLFTEPDACNSSVYIREWKTIQDYVDSKAGGANDYMTSSQVQLLVNNALVTPVANISSNTARITALEESAGSAGGGPHPTVLAKSNGPVDAYDTSATYGPMYLNRFFADNFDSDETLSGLILMGSDHTGDLIRIDYTAHTPSSLHLYVYDGSAGSNMSGAITKELYKDGVWVFDPVVNSLSSNSSWKVRSDLSKTAAQIIHQLLSATTKNGIANYTASAENAWIYTPLANVSDSIVPPNLCDSDFSKAFNYTNTGSFIDIAATNSGGSKVLYQCMWEGNLTWGGSQHAVRVAFRPIWSNFRSDGPITFTSESIGGNTLTLSSQVDSGGYYPKLVLMLNDGTTAPGGTLYYKRLYVL